MSESANDAQATNPFVFIVGCPRSGTTLLERMVNEHPAIAIIHESHWISRFFKSRTGLTPEGLVTPDLIDQLSQHHRFHLLRMTREDLEQLVMTSEPMRYADFVARIFDLYGRRAGKPLVGDKTTGGYLRNIGLLHGLWPHARFVHILRDGRDVCLSMLKWKKADRAAGRLEIWKEDPVATTALWWEWQVRKGLQQAAALGPGLYYELRYERLVRNPAEQCTELCRFLGLQYEEAMIRFHEGRTLDEPGMTANRAWLPPTPNLRDWRTQMKKRDIELFEAIAGDLLSDLGYERMFEAVSAEVATLAQRFRSWWDVDRRQTKAGSGHGNRRG